MEQTQNDRFSSSVSKEKSSYCDRYISVVVVDVVVVAVVVVVQNFNVVHYSKSIEGINTKLGILAQHDKRQLQDKEINSESYNFGVMPLFNLNFYVE